MCTACDEQLLKGKEEPEYGYSSAYVHREAPESGRYYKYPESSSSDVRNRFRRPYGEALDGYNRTDYSTTELRGVYGRAYGGSEPLSRGEEYRKPYREGSGEYRKSSGGHRRGFDDSVIMFRVPMCCDKCKEKVEMELGKIKGVESVYCDQYASRVTVRGGGIDIDKCLKRAEHAVKKKCKLIRNENGHIGDIDNDDGNFNSSRGMTVDSTRSGTYQNMGRGRSIDYRRDFERSGGHAQASSGSLQITSRPTLGRLPSFAGGKVSYHDGVGPRGQDYDANDYNGFRRLPSFNKHRHSEAEYIAVVPDQRPQLWSNHRDYYTFRRIPSFNRHRHHDAEYIIAPDREYTPLTFVENSGSSYTTVLNDQPMYRSQVSFSRLPISNPNYVKHIDGVAMYSDSGR